MARLDHQERASARSDNRRMTGNVNIYICSEAFEKGKKNADTDTESAFSNVSETTKINLNPSNVVSTRVNKNRYEKSNGANNNREKLIMTTELNERQSNEVKFQSNGTKLHGNSDEKHKLSGIVSCRCPQYDESDVWLRNLKNKRERKAAVGVTYEGKKVIEEETRSSSKDQIEGKMTRNGMSNRKVNSLKHDSKVSKREKKMKKKVKEPKKSNNNTSWFNYFRRNNDVHAKEDIVHEDVDLCTCKWKSNSLKNRNKKHEAKKRKKDKDDKKSISPKTTREDYNRSESKNGEVRPKGKMTNTFNDGTKKPDRPKKIKNVDGKTKEKSLLEENMNNKKLSPNEMNRNQKLPKSPENRKNMLDRKSALKNKSIENKIPAKEISFNTNKKNNNSSVNKVEVKNIANNKKIPTTARKSNANTDDKKDLKHIKTEGRTSCFLKLFNLFKSKREITQSHTKKMKSKCHESCSELKKTTRTNSSVRRKNKSRRKTHKSELAGKINGQKLTEKAIISSNKSNIQVNERKSRDLEKKSVVKESTKRNLERTNGEESKTNKSLQTDYSQNSLRICFSCLFPAGNCLCKRKFAERQSCDCRKVTFCCDENCKPFGDKIPYGSAILPYQKMKNYPNVINEMQGKMNDSINNSKSTCCYENNERCACTCDDCKDDCTDKKPRAKCYYCKNFSSQCGCVIRTPGCSSSKQQ